MIRTALPVPLCETHRGNHYAGCTDCQRYSRNRARLRYWARKEGIDEGQKVPARQARDRINWLRKQGMSVTQIAERLGLSREHVGVLSNGRARVTTRLVTRRVLELKPEPYRTNWSRDSAGTIRRIQALSYMGYSYKAIAKMYGDVTGKQVSLQAVFHWMREPAVTHAVADAMVIVYDKFSMIPCEAPSANRVSRLAKKKGWVGPLAWDDETIDDPNAKPDLGNKQGYALADEAAVCLAVAGQLKDVGRPLNKAEKREAAWRLHRLGLSNKEIGRKLGMAHDAVWQIINRQRAERGDP